MEYSLLKEVNKKSLNAYLTERVYKDLYFPTLFPLKSTPYLTIDALMAEQGSRVVADIVAYNSSAPEKTRKTVSKLTGDIPPIRVARKLTEKDLNDYNVMKAQANPDAEAILQLVFGDVDFVVDAVLGRLEWMALKALSYGTISLSASNNAGVITENALDYQVPTANKVGVGTSWVDASSADPIADIQSVVSLAAALGVRLKYILMNPATFARFRACASVKDYTAVLVGYNGGRISIAPSLDIINQSLQADEKPSIKIVDQNLGIETAEHVISYANPWTDHYITYLPEVQCGRTLHGPIAEETNPPKQVVQAKSGPVLVSKFSDVNPVCEWTKGEANACPVWTNVDRCFIQKTNATSWS